MNKKKPKTIVIGLDGATWTVLDYLMNQGIMNHFKGILNRGVRCILKSTIPPITGTAWVSFATGKNPGKHGCFDFTYPTTSLDILKTISSKRINGRTFYEYLNENGKKNILINLPGSYPPRTDDITITSLFTKGEQFVFPSSLKEEIQTLKDYRLTPDMKLFTNHEKKEYINDIRKLERNRFECAKELFKKEWDLFFLLFSGTDWIHHVLYDKLATGELPADHEAVQFYKEIDHYLNWFSQNLDENTNLIVLSDHGFDTYKGEFYINEWLRKEGYLFLKNQSTTTEKEHKWAEEFAKASENKIKVIKLPFFLKEFLQKNEAIKSMSIKLYKWMRDKLSLRFEVETSVDLERSVAYSTSGELNGIYINCKNRFSNGIVEQENYERIRLEIVNKLQTLKDKHANRIFKNVWTKEEVFKGEMLHEAPDIVIELGEYVIGGNFPMQILEENQVIYHHSDGIFFGMGPAFKRNKQIDNASILDLAPTILYLMEQKVPQDMDGKVLTWLMKDEFVEKRQVQYSQATEEAVLKGKKFTFDNEEDDLVIERLKGLGYLS